MWMVQKIMVPISTNGNEKVIKDTPKQRLSTRSVTQKLMGDAMKSNKVTTAENRRKRLSSEAVFEEPSENVVEVSGEDPDEGVCEIFLLIKGTSHLRRRVRVKEKEKLRLLWERRLVWIKKRKSFSKGEGII